MESAVLRIRFASLIKDIQKDKSKCCVEIVPQVSEIQNLSKCMNVTGNLVECVVPMTYKIIIKKDQDLPEKIYHSCVDLIRGSSIANYIDEMWNGVPKIYSETSLVKKIIPDDTELANIILSKATNTNLNQSDKEQNTVSVSALIATSSSSHNSDSGDQYHSIQSSFATSAVMQPHYYKVTNQEEIAEIGLKITDYVKQLSEIGEDVGDIENGTCSPSEQSKKVYRPKLSLSPIYLINTDTASDLSVYKNASSTYYSPASINSAKLKQYRSLSPKRVIREAGDNNVTVKYCRKDPKKRVDYYVHEMEREILPLKMLLNEIRDKCISLGVLFGSRDKSKVIMYKSLSPNESALCRWKKEKFSGKVSSGESKRTQNSYRTKVQKDERITQICDLQLKKCYKNEKCNRVVYSLVFNE